MNVRIGDEVSLAFDDTDGSADLPDEVATIVAFIGPNKDIAVLSKSLDRKKKHPVSELVAATTKECTRPYCEPFHVVRGARR